MTRTASTHKENPMIGEQLARVALTMFHQPGDQAITQDLDRALSEVTDAQLFAASSALTLAEGQGMRFVIPGDEEWPTRLDDLALPNHPELAGVPYGLWVRGELRLDALDASVAIIGSRSATTYGTQVAADFAAGFARKSMTVVSGGAYGIDQAAHRGALAGVGQTVAVLACGADLAYPAAHKQMLDHIADGHGCVVSEVAPGTTATKSRFLDRNRIVAALTMGTVVVEAGLRSGTLNTTRWANRLGRPVFGVPGPITSAASVGVHHLIRSGQALLVTSPAEVLERLNDVDEEVES